MKATSELEKILDIRYIHGIIAYLRRRREVMFIFLKHLSVITTEVKYRCNVVRTIEFSSLCVIYVIVSYNKRPCWGPPKTLQGKGKVSQGSGLSTGLHYYHFCLMELLCLPRLLQQ